jgi:hypothetical protein
MNSRCHRDIIYIHAIQYWGIPAAISLGAEGSLLPRLQIFCYRKGINRLN